MNQQYSKIYYETDNNIPINKEYIVICNEQIPIDNQFIRTIILFISKIIKIPILYTLYFDQLIIVNDNVNLVSAIPIAAQFP